MSIRTYRDGNTTFLELHAMRAPVGGYAHWITNDDESYNFAVHCAIVDFQEAYGVSIYQLGRSGRHICITDTPAHRRRYARLSQAAINAARAMWADMRTEREPDAVLSEN